ncbi:MULTISPECIES: hypothetical protein [Mesorhizobium]|uniref:Uncharacterized protein n=2 Tax=Mesorhizobium TaxID=68287 RepID=A0ABU4X647_9HYPH|nr:MULTISPECIES: hypothetical protein [unclassified Mesorhizobium]MDX8443801.1 hypothetical protein [Mesorhizobium sp. VK3E]MDX8483295.1 hypothetical protein [Mesorhizobium sp. VK24D]MDX8516523.1 hypothetical protein [Mesorhizobium sp. VK23E]
MRQTKKALPFVPSEFHASTVEDSKGVIGILSIHTTERPFGYRARRRTLPMQS